REFVGEDLDPAPRGPLVPGGVGDLESRRVEERRAILVDGTGPRHQDRRRVSLNKERARSRGGLQGRHVDALVLTEVPEPDRSPIRGAVEVGGGCESDRPQIDRLESPTQAACEAASRQGDDLVRGLRVGDVKQQGTGDSSSRGRWGELYGDVAVGTGQDG